MTSRSIPRTREYRLRDVDGDDRAPRTHCTLEQREISSRAAADFHHSVVLTQLKSVNGLPSIRPIAKADGVRETRREITRCKILAEMSIRVGVGHHACFVHAVRYRALFWPALKAAERLS